MARQPARPADAGPGRGHADQAVRRRRGLTLSPDGPSSISPPASRATRAVEHQLRPVARADGRSARAARPHRRQSGLGRPAGRVSPDGRRLAYRAQKRPGFESDRFGIWVMDLPPARVARWIPRGTARADQIAWSADGARLLVTADDVGAKTLFRHGPGDGAVRPLTAPAHVERRDPRPAARDRRQDAFDRPGRSVGADAAARPARQLTHVNAPSARRHRRSAPTNSSASPAGTARPCTATWSSPPATSRAASIRSSS